MKKQALLFVSIFFLITGCKKAEEKPVVFGVDISDSTNIKTIEQDKDAVKECFSYEKNGSLVSMQIQTSDKGSNGTLTYALAEKDKNTGTFKGKIENNILIADYTFQSEGTTSTRQVAFQFQNKQWIEGCGEMNEDGTVFKDVSQIKFSSAMPLSKTNCSK